MFACTPCTLTSRTPVSFTASDVPGLADWLQQHGYSTQPARSTAEYGRYQRDASLIVLYHSGTVLLQGRDIASAHQLLAELVVPQPSLFETGADWTATVGTAVLQ